MGHLPHQQGRLPGRLRAARAHNSRDPKTHTPKAEIFFHFGRREEVDLEALRRLVRSITRLLGPEDELKAAASAVEGQPVRFIESRPMGEAWRLRGVWERLQIDRAKVKAEERLDGKYLIVTSDDSLSPEDVALGYTQLAEVERAWRTMQSELEIRPMHHRKAERMRAHVLLCWLALLLVRLIEVTCTQTWPRVRQEMDRLHRGVFETRSGRFVQRTELTALQHEYLKAMQVAPPPRFERIEAKARRKASAKATA
ncbi:MAG TPA: transposase [Thermoanaerobaculaceae bacterium]|nr:transposase [Thermoanaerobaculaceae bacterium]HRS15361.1 transposase [Thermoanaerobaculaceae bacterium]